MFTDVAILAGGFGERLWPASTPEFPKQFMTLGSGDSFLQSSVRRALSIRPEGKIVIVTRRELLDAVTAQCKAMLEFDSLSSEEKSKISDDLIVIAEPEPKHTTAPVILAAKFTRDFCGSGGRSMLVLTSDHVIGPAEAFASDCKKAADAAEKGNFVCFAIPPTEPSTGYGYIRTGESISCDDSVFSIAQFKEKPDFETAKAYLAKGGYWWNSGMFGFSTESFLVELEKCAPDAAQAFRALDGAAGPEVPLSNGIKSVSQWPAMASAYGKVPAVAIDISVAERTSRAAAVRASFSWDDVGSWDSFEKHFERNSGRTAEIGSRNNFVYSDIPVALCGVEDLVVVVKNGRALVMKKGQSALVRQAVQAMKD